MWENSIPPCVTIQNHPSRKLDVLDYFKIIVKNLKLLKVGTHENTLFPPIVQQKNDILVQIDNMYMAIKKMKVY